MPATPTPDREVTMPATAPIIVRTECRARVGIDTDLGLIYGLTDCCSASGKGYDDEGGEPYVGCRSCSREVANVYGMGAEPSNVPAALALLVTLAEIHSCPVSDSCATHTLSIIEERISEAGA